MSRRSALLLLVSTAGFSCSSSDSSGPARPDGATTFAPVDAGACGITTAKLGTEPAIHVEQGSSLTFASNPPCGGNHYGSWATWGSHEDPLPRGNYIHNLEHGAIVLLYRCPSRSACPEIAAQLEALASSMPSDPKCGPPVRNRFVITPDPELPAGTVVAAAAWGFNLVARCFDEAAFRTFASEHYARASEDTCAEGSFTGVRDAGSDDAAASDTSSGG